MAVKTFAAIDVGSSEISMKIYEISRARLSEIDHLRHGMDMGTEVYKTGKLGHEHIEELCRILCEFKACMETYRVESYAAYATSAIREAQNALILLDRISVRSGLKITVLSNSEQRLLHYKAIALKEEDFYSAIQKSTAIVDIGGGSIQISLFEKDSLVSTQNLRLGVLRLADQIHRLNLVPSKHEALLSEIIDPQLAVYKKQFMRGAQIENVIIIDDYLSDIFARGHYSEGGGYSGRALLEELLRDISASFRQEMAGRLGISEDKIILLQISAVLLQRFMAMTDAQRLWAPGTTLCDGIAFEYAEKKKIIQPGHDFEQDIIACAMGLSRRYRGSRRRGETLVQICLAIYDSMKKIHGLGRRERLMLRLSALLSDCGHFISMATVAESSSNIILATEIIGLSHLERVIVAHVVKFSHQDFAYFEHAECSQGIDLASYLQIAKLVAILRIAQGLDAGRDRQFQSIKALIKEDEMILTVDTDKDIDLERGLLADSFSFFAEVFGIRAQIRRKRGS